MLRCALPCQDVTNLENDDFVPFVVRCDEDAELRGAFGRPCPRLLLHPSLVGPIHPAGADNTECNPFSQEINDLIVEINNLVNQWEAVRPVPCDSSSCVVLAACLPPLG
jgi:hypothetical protein